MPNHLETGGCPYVHVETDPSILPVMEYGLSPVRPVGCIPSPVKRFFDIKRILCGLVLYFFY